MLAVSLLLALFAMAFGTRRLNPAEQQDGLILAMAAESMVKLVAFLAVGAFVVWGLHGGIGALTAVGARPIPGSPRSSSAPDPAIWLVDHAPVGERGRCCCRASSM